MATPRRTRFANVAKVVQWRDGLFQIVELRMSVSREQLVLGVVSVVSCALPMLACAQPQGADDTAARVGDTLITLGDVEDAWRQDDAASRMRMLQQLYDTRRQTLERVIGEHLVEREADARGMTREELLEAELPSRTEPIGDPEVELIYQRNQNAFGGRTLEQMRPEIMAFLEQQRPTQALHQFMDELRSAATDVVVLLDPPRQEVDVLPEDPSRGPEDAPIVLVEFSDFQCPFCQQATETIAQIVEGYGDQIRLIYKDYPLPSDADAFKAAEAGNCANDQGMFWELHDKMFQTQDGLDVASLKTYAVQLGLDADTFSTCLDEGKHAERVEGDLAVGREYGVSSTPTIFINGRTVMGALPFEAFDQIIQEELAATQR
jgi:protein-disulfide isomerase